MTDEICELKDHELDSVSGGGIIATVWHWLTDDSAKYDPVKACPQCYAGGGGGARG